jgi:hypothetical protein
VCGPRNSMSSVLQVPSSPKYYLFNFSEPVYPGESHVQLPPGSELPSCNTLSSSNSSELLLGFKASIENAEDTVLVSWHDGSQPCGEVGAEGWAGITCGPEGQIREM